jgi:DNA polymerase III epsilon subunit-like protein
MTETARPDLYISADVETDGPIPGKYSLLAFGLVVVGSFDGERFSRGPSREEAFYAELKPISDEFEPQALEVNGLDRERLRVEGADPSEAMSAAASWICDVSQGHRPVLVAYPVAYDWSFLYWYFERFADTGSPFGHSSCLDIRTLYQSVSGTVFDRSGKRHMPQALLPEEPHTHNALDDAREQGELFANLLGWVLRRRAGHVEPREQPPIPSWLDGHVVRLT